MIERLDQLTLHDLIELSCGDLSPLGIEDELEATKTANRIMEDYLSMSQPIKAKVRLSERESDTKMAMREKCLRICMLLVELGHSEKSKEVLMLLGVDDVHLKDAHAIRVRCKAMLDDVQFEIRRAKEAEQQKPMPNQSPEQTRKAWYSEMAFVMSMLKMAFDPKTMNAAVYANLVHQAVERSKMMAKAPQMGMFM